VRVVCLFLFGWHLIAGDWLQDVKQRGAIAESRRQWAEAATLYASALERLDDAGPLADRFWLLTSLAEISFERQDYSAARQWLAKADNVVGSFDENSPERVRLLNAWGTVHLVEGNLTAAQHNLSRAAAISESVATPADLAAVLHNLAAVEMHIGLLQDAASRERRALTLWRQHFGDRHPYVIKAWISLSSLQGLSGDWQGAAASLEEVLRIDESQEALANYATVLEKLKRGREAKQVRRRIHMSMPGPPPLADVRENRRNQILTR
jgi:tetratricopeptide (TPR) repeat protein